MVITLKLGEQTQKEMISFYEEMKREKTPLYALFQATCADNVITLYQSGKAVFQGGSADVDAELWRQRDKTLYPNNIQEEKKKPKKELSKERFDNNVIGSDEVGTGDFFGPIVVSSAFVDQEEIEFLKEIGVVDSKKLNDDQILKIGQQLINTISFQTIIYGNVEYNNTHCKDYNMNKIKAVLHNKVLLQLAKLTPRYQQIVVDQFTTPRSYFFYLKDQKNVIRKITFLEKAESKSLAVACASIISRYFFIKEMDKLSAHFKINLPYGANTHVDQVAIEFAKKYGIDSLKKVAKLNFKNFQKVKEAI